MDKFNNQTGILSAFETKEDESNIGPICYGYAEVARKVATSDEIGPNDGENTLVVDKLRNPLQGASA